MLHVLRRRRLTLLLPHNQKKVQLEQIALTGYVMASQTTTPTVLVIRNGIAQHAVAGWLCR